MDSEQQPAMQPENKPSKSYGKRPVWQWVVLYLIVAIIVYGLIYLIWFHKGNGSGGSGY